MNERKVTLIDGSRLIIESTVRAGGDVFVGYPITPANLLFLYSSQRFPASLAAPDEITTLQWMSGFAADGKVPATATSFPGLALMLESINMAYMMELPMVVILPQRLGPATGTATCGAQGDLLLLNGLISGGYPIPTLCISSMEDCWNVSAQAVDMSVKLRTPVVLLTSKEMVMTLQRFDISGLPEIKPAKRHYYDSSETYVPYKPSADLVPPFLPVGNDSHQVRLTASTHDYKGIIQHTSPQAMENTARLKEKLVKNLKEFTLYDHDHQDGSESLVVAFDITAEAAKEAVETIRNAGKKVSLLVPKTLFPVPEKYLEIISSYKRVVIAEENLDGQYRSILFGAAGKAGVTGVNSIGRMIAPAEIIRELES